MPEPHHDGHKPIAAIYACYQCGRITMKITNTSMRQEQVAVTLPLTDVRALMSKVLNVLRGEPVIQPVHVPPSAHSDW